MIIILILYAVVYVECGGWEVHALAIQKPIYFCVLIRSTKQCKYSRNDTWCTKVLMYKDL